MGTAQTFSEVGGDECRTLTRSEQGGGGVTLQRLESIAQAPCLPPPYGQLLAKAGQPNQNWCADFKGWFRTSDRTRCDPLTITDAQGRYLLCCQISARTDTAHVEALFDMAFREFGLL